MLYFRDAQPRDADAVAALIHESSRNLYDYVFEGVDPLPFLRRDFVRGDGVFGFRHSVVAVMDGEVVGAQTGYPGARYPRMMAQTLLSALQVLGPVRLARIALRGRDLGKLFITPRRDAFFLANGCIDGKRRGTGVFTGLMDASLAVARRHGLRSVEFDVSFRNARAQGVLEHLGYRVVAERPYTGTGGLDGFRRMTGPVKAA